MPTPPDQARGPLRSGLLVVAIAVVAFNLRPVVVSLGAVLRDIQADLGMSATVAGVLTTLPVLAFGFVGLAAGGLARRVGIERALTASLVLLVLGLVARAFAPSTVWLLVLTGAAVTGIAVGNILLPVAVKRWFPDRVGRMTGLYSMSIAIGAAISPALTVPVAEMLTGWRGGLGVWALPAALALGLWVAGLRGERPATAASLATVELRRAHRSVQAWGLTVYFGLQSLEAYVAMGWLSTILRDAGHSPAYSGTLLGVTMVLGAPISLLLPVLAARSDDQRPIVVTLFFASVSAYLGLILAPQSVPWLWTILLGIGMGAFPLALVMIGLRSSTDQGTSELSSLTQGIGYLIAASGPIAVGALHDLTGGWSVPLGVLLALLVPKLVAGLLAGRPGFVDMPVDTPRR